MNDILDTLDALAELAELSAENIGEILEFDTIDPYDWITNAYELMKNWPRDEYNKHIEVFAERYGDYFANDDVAAFTSVWKWREEIDKLYDRWDEDSHSVGVAIADETDRIFYWLEYHLQNVQKAIRLYKTMYKELIVWEEQ